MTDRLTYNSLVQTTLPIGTLQDIMVAIIDGANYNQSKGYKHTAQAQRRLYARLSAEWERYTDEADATLNADEANEVFGPVCSGYAVQS